MSITNGYCTSDDVIAELGVQVPGDRVVRVERAIESASRMIDRYTGRRFWQDGTVVARTYWPDDTWCLYSAPQSVLDISTTTGLIVKVDGDLDGTYETTLTINSHFILTPPNAAADGFPYTGIELVDSTYSFPVGSRPSVQVTAKFGFASVPADIAKATVLQAVSLYKGADAVFGVLQWADGGGASRVRGMSPQVQMLIEPYCLARVG